ncbi:hypothetical protein GF406_18795 [candidate division KSB1 bacterium]|nr:hypothetical protein [candidate division KSB1 bacterium]
MIKIIKCFIRLFFLLLIFISCSIDPVVQDSETVGDYFAFCTLMTFTEKQSVLVGRTVVENLPRYYPDAKVTLSGSGYSSQLIYTKNGVFEEQTPFIPIIGDSTYSLEVSFPDGHTIRGKTKIPGDFTLIFPQNHDTLFLKIGPRENPTKNMQVPKIIWSVSNGAYYYYIRSNDLYGAGNEFTKSTQIFLPYNPYGCMNCTIPSEYTSILNLKITAIDSTRFYRYFSPDSTIAEHDIDENSHKYFIRTGYMDFSGGLGFFNATNRFETDIVLNVQIIQ